MDFSNTKLSLRRPLTDYSKVRALIGRLRRNRLALVPPIEQGFYLNVGCGSNIVPRFVNIDYNWQPGVDLVWDIARRLPFREAMIGGIFTEHCLEHLTLEDGKSLIAECHRIMAVGSRIRIIVPDLELYARAYVDWLSGREPTLPNIKFPNNTGINRPVALINELFYGPDHRFIYDFATLKELLEAAGFNEITRCSYRKGADNRLLIDDEGHVSESLYVEARK